MSGGWSMAMRGVACCTAVSALLLPFMQADVRAQGFWRTLFAVGRAADGGPTVSPVLREERQRPEKVFVEVKSPKGGETILLDKDGMTQVQFAYGGSFRPTGIETYAFRVELWRHGVLLGNVSKVERFFLNTRVASTVMDARPGAYYFQNAATGTRQRGTAEPGPGYQYRVVLLEATTPPGKPTAFTDIAEDFSDGTFSFHQPEKRVPRSVSHFLRTLLIPLRTLVHWVGSLF